jgi:hypothetical protein
MGEEVARNDPDLIAEHEPVTLAISHYFSFLCLPATRMPSALVSQRPFRIFRVDELLRSPVDMGQFQTGKIGGNLFL